MKLFEVALGFSLATVAWTAPASATPNFPGEVAAHLGTMSACGAPPCTICHLTLSGGTGTAVKPFATTLKGFGLVKYDTTSLDTALDRDSTTMTASAGDGVPDITKLKMCNDPNTVLASGDGGPVAAPPPTIEYGCVGQVAGGPAEASAGVSALTIVGLAIAARRSRRTRR
jgi:hypothetical protein